MIFNSFQNNLKFSRNEAIYNQSNGILNQNPIIITKTDAYNLSYTDVDKLRLAQLLAKRDLKSARKTEFNKAEEISKSIQTVKPENKNTKSKASVKNQKLIQEKRVSSIKRVPGPQTPNKITVKRNMPIRSISPPTKDNDRVWKPKPCNDIHKMKGNEIEKLQMKVDQCSNKLDGLEKHLKSQSYDTRINVIPSHSCNPVKSGRNLTILSDKLRQLMDTKISSQIDIDQVVPPVTHSQKSPQGVDVILFKLDNLVLAMDAIQSRWHQLAYETVSVYSSDDELSDNEIRFTRNKAEAWQDMVDINQYEQSRKINLDMPKKAIAELDKARLPPDLFQFKGVPVKPVHVDWMSDDLINEILEEVVDEINDANNQLVDALLNSELMD